MSSSDINHRLFGEYLHWMAHKEMALGDVRPDLWASAVAESGGEEGRARDIYLQWRAQSLREEEAVAERFLRLLQQSEDSAVKVHNAVVFFLARPASAPAESPG